MSDIEHAAGTVVFYGGTKVTHHGFYRVVGSWDGRHAIVDNDGRRLRCVRGRHLLPVTVTEDQQLIIMLLDGHGLALDLAGFEADCHTLLMLGLISASFVDDGHDGFMRYWLTVGGQLLADALNGR